MLLHVTSQDRLDSIISSGVVGRSYWTDDVQMASYYLSVVTDEGQTPVLLSLDPEVLDRQHIRPDFPGIEEPITCVLGKTEDEVHGEWEDSGQTWEDSLALVKSICYLGNIPASAISVIGSTGPVPLTEYQTSHRRPGP